MVPDVNYNTLYLLFMFFFSHLSYANEAEHVGALISACSDGQMEICDQISRMEHPLEPVSALDAMALSFASRSASMQLDKNKIPNLGKAYPLIVKDYFSNEKITDESRKKWLKTANLEDCGKHYHIEWRIDKNWWPVDNNEDPDWRALYPHALDHYFGYCVRQ